MTSTLAVSSPRSITISLLNSCRQVLVISMAFWPVTLSLYALHARILLGRWPSPDNPDPKALGLPLEHWIVGASLSIFLIGVLAVPAIWAGLRLLGARWHRAWIGSFLLLLALGVFIWVANLG